MHGLIGSFIAKPGARDELVAIISGSAIDMPGCLSYVVATDPSNPDTIWVTEVWDNDASHKASLAIPAVKAAIEKAMPLIAGFGESRVVAPVAMLGKPVADRQL